jgi:Flp pilus assembly protein TadG
MPLISLLVRRFSSGGSERGAAFVELAVTLPLLVVVVLGTIDFGRVFYTTMELNNAARAGAQYGAQNLATASDIAGMNAAATAASPDISPFTVTPSAPTCYCVVPGNPFVNNVACSGTCVTGHMAVSVTVTATKTFSMFSTFPGLPSSVSITRAARMRAQ